MVKFDLECIELAGKLALEEDEQSSEEEEESGTEDEEKESLETELSKLKLDTNNSLNKPNLIVELN